MLKEIVAISRISIISIAIILTAACESNPPKDDHGIPESLDGIMLQRAEAAFNSSEYKTTAILIEPLAIKGNATAQYTLGYLYYSGKGVDYNLEKARDLFEKAAKQNNINAIKALKLLQPRVNKKPAQPSAPASNEISQSVIDLRNNSKQLELSAVQKTLQNTESEETYPPSYVQQYSNSDISAAEHEGNIWVNKQPANHFSIQLASTASEKNAISYVKNVELDGAYYFQSSKNGIIRYTIIHGNFQDYTRAKLKLDRLTKRGFKNAWIRRIGQIQAQITNSR